MSTLTTRQDFLLAFHQQRMQDFINKSFDEFEVGSKVGGTTEEVFTNADLVALETSPGLITVPDGTALTIEMKGGPIAFTTDFATEGSGQFQIIGKSIDAILQWGGAGTFLSGSTSACFLDNIVLVSTSTGKFLDLDGGSFALRNSFVANFANLGSHINSGGSLIRFSTIADCASAFDIASISISFVNNAFLLPALTGNIVNVGTGVPFTFVTATDNIVIARDSNAFFRFDPALTENSSIDIVHNKVAPGKIFDRNGGIQGAFTVVVDKTIPSTATTVTDSVGAPGTPRFTFTGETVHVNQEVVNVGHSESTYNGSFIITATDNTTYYEIGSLVYTSDDSGTFTSDSIELTDTTTALVDGNTLVVSTTNATDYDGGATVYNQQTNTFQINREYDPSEDDPQAGTWNTDGVDQTDPRVLATQNAGFVDSKYILAAHVNANSTGVGTIINGVFTDMVFGTGGVGLVSGSTMERFKQLDPIKGLEEYTGKEPFDGSLPWHYTAKSSGGAVEFEYKWVRSISTTISAATIAFVDSGPDTITDSGNGFLTAGFKAGDTINVAGSASNDGDYTIASVVAGTITLVASDALSVESAGASVVINGLFGDFLDARKGLVEVGGTASSTGGSQPMLLVKGDKIKPQITRNSGASTIIVSHASIG